MKPFGLTGRRERHNNTRLQGNFCTAKITFNVFFYVIKNVETHLKCLTKGRKLGRLKKYTCDLQKGFFELVKASQLSARGKGIRRVLCGVL